MGIQATNKRNIDDARGIRPQTQTLVALVCEAILDRKGLDLLALDVTHLTDVTDCTIICSGTSTRHVKAISDSIKEMLKLHKEEPISATGYEQSEWILIDFGDVVVHVFHEPIRQYYDLEDLWRAAHRMELPPEPEN